MKKSLNLTPARLKCRFLEVRQICRTITYATHMADDARHEYSEITIDKHYRVEGVIKRVEFYEEVIVGLQHKLSNFTSLGGSIAYNKIKTETKAFQEINMLKVDIERLEEEEWHVRYWEEENWREDEWAKRVQKRISKQWTKIGRLESLISNMRLEYESKFTSTSYGLDVDEETEIMNSFENGTQELHGF